MIVVSDLNEMLYLSPVEKLINKYKVLITDLRDLSISIIYVLAAPNTFWHKKLVDEKMTELWQFCE